MPEQPGQSIETLWVDIAARADRLVQDAEAAVNEVVKKLDRIEEKTQETQGAFSRLGDYIKGAFSVAAGIGLAHIGMSLTNAIQGFGRALIETNAQLEMYEQSFTVLTGSAQEAGEIIEWIKEEAKRTPFDIPGLIQASQMLMTWGLDLQEWFTVVGDTAAAMNKPLSQVVNAIGTLASGQTGEAVRRFRDLGINLREYDQFKFDAQGAMVTPLQEAVPMVRQILEERFGGMMEAQSKTWNGVMSNMRDTWMQFVQVVGEPIFDTLKEVLLDIQAWVEENQEEIQTFGVTLGEILQAVIENLKETLGLFGDLFGLIRSGLDLLPGGGGDGDRTFAETLDRRIKQLREFTALATAIPVGGPRAIWQTLVGGAAEFLETRSFRMTAEELARFPEYMRDYLIAVGGAVEGTEELGEKTEEVSERVKAGIEAIRKKWQEVFPDWLQEVGAELSDPDLLKMAEQAEDAEMMAQGLEGLEEWMGELGLTSVNLSAKFREQNAALLQLNEAYDAAVEQYDQAERAAQALADVQERLRLEHEATLKLATETAEKLTQRLEDLVDDYTALTDRLRAETAEAISEIEMEAGRKEGEAVAKSQKQIADLRDNFAREQLRARRRFNLEWARLIRDQNQEVIDAEWEYEYAKRNLLLEGDEIALAELETRYAHEKDVRGREHRDARDDMQARFDLEEQERQEQFELQLRQLNERLVEELAAIRAEVAEEVQAKKDALDERLADEEQKLNDRLAKIGELLADEVGDNQTAADWILAIWTNMYGAQVAEAISAGMEIRADMNRTISLTLQAQAAIARFRAQRPTIPYPRPGEPGRRYAGGYTPMQTGAVIGSDPGEWIATAQTTQALERALGAPLTQRSVQSLARRVLDVNVRGIGVPADVMRQIRREMIDAMSAQSEF